MAHDAIQITLVQTRDCWDYIFWLSSVILPLAIMIFTLRSNKKNQVETNRLAIMPMFDIDNVTGEIDAAKLEQGKHIIDINLKNVGNGTATFVSNKWIKISQDYVYFPTYQSPHATYSVYKEFSFDSSVTSVGRIANTKVIRHAKSNDEINEDTLILEVHFRDLIGNAYRQLIGISFFFSKDTGQIISHTMIPNIPEHIKRGDHE